MGDSPKSRRRSVRLPTYDYGWNGAYFVTIVSQRRACLFGLVQVGQMELTAAGKIVASCWRAIPEHFAHVTLDAFIVMPNHVHGILLFGQVAVGRGMACHAPTATANPSAIRRFSHPPAGALSAVVGSFKSAASRAINHMRGTPGTAVWQRNYYEHVVRDPEDLAAVRGYIVSNPMQWERDDENPDRVP